MKRQYNPRSMEGKTKAEFDEMQNKIWRLARSSFVDVSAFFPPDSLVFARCSLPRRQDGSCIEEGDVVAWKLGRVVGIEPASIEVGGWTLLIKFPDIEGVYNTRSVNLCKYSPHLKGEILVFKESM